MWFTSNIASQMSFSIFTLLTACLLHPVHETVMEVQWNPESKRIEIAVRLYQEDELWLSKQITKSLRTDSSAEVVNAAREKLLRDQIRVSDRPQKKKSGRDGPRDKDAVSPDDVQADVQDDDRYVWVGRQEANAYVWWYFEIEPRSGEEPEWIDVSLLFDRSEDYVHRVVFLDANPKRAESISSQRPRIRFTPLGPSKSIGSSAK